MGTTKSVDQRTGRAAQVQKQPKKTLGLARSVDLGDAEARDQRLGFFIHDVSRLRRTAFDEFMKPLGVTRSQWWVLTHLLRHSGVIQTDLAQELALNKASLTTLVDRLEASGLVERRPDATDRRVKRLFLSRKAEKLVEEINSKSHEMSERVLQGLTRKERDELNRMLLHVKRNLQAINGESGGSTGEI